MSSVTFIIHRGWPDEGRTSGSSRPSGFLGELSGLRKSNAEPEHVRWSCLSTLGVFLTRRWGQSLPGSRVSAGLVLRAETLPNVFIPKERKEEGKSTNRAERNQCRCLIPPLKFPTGEFSHHLILFTVFSLVVRLSAGRIPQKPTKEYYTLYFGGSHLVHPPFFKIMFYNWAKVERGNNVFLSFQFIDDFGQKLNKTEQKHNNNSP